MKMAKGCDDGSIQTTDEVIKKLLEPIKTWVSLNMAVIFNCTISLSLLLCYYNPLAMREQRNEIKMYCP